MVVVEYFIPGRADTIRSHCNCCCGRCRHIKTRSNLYPVPSLSYSSRQRNEFPWSQANIQKKTINVTKLSCIQAHRIVYWCPCIAINVSVQYNGWFLPDMFLKKNQNAPRPSEHPPVIHCRPYSTTIGESD